MQVRLIGRPPGRPQRLWLRGKTWLGARGAGRRYADLERFCMFIGYPRSSHSLIGALIDAHPDAVIAHELDALDYFDRRFNETQIFQLIEECSQQFKARDHRWTGYSYAVPGQHQGSVRTLRVIGDKKGGASNGRIARDATLLERFEGALSVPLYMLHVVRNPFDNLATATQRSRADIPLPRQIERFRELYATSQRVAESLGERFHTIRSEQFVAQPRAELERICAFLGLEPSADYLDACASIVLGEPRVTRHEVEWSAEDRAAVEALIAQYPFLEGYAFDE